MDPPLGLDLRVPATRVPVRRPVAGRAVDAGITRGDVMEDHRLVAVDGLRPAWMQVGELVVNHGCDSASVLGTHRTRDPPNTRDTSHREGRREDRRPGPPVLDWARAGPGRSEAQPQRPQSGTSVTSGRTATSACPVRQHGRAHQAATKASRDWASAASTRARTWLSSRSSRVTRYCVWVVMPPPTDQAARPGYRRSAARSRPCAGG